MPKLKIFLMIMCMIYLFFGFAILEVVETNIALSTPIDWLMWAIASIFILIGCFVPVAIIDSEISFKRWRDEHRK